MSRFRSVLAAISVAASVAGCDSNDVSYDPATNSDSTAPAVNLLLVRAGQADLEVQEQRLPAPPRPVSDFGPLQADTVFDFSVLATATDSASGIRNVKLLMNRTVCYTSSSGAVAEARSATVLRKESTYTDRSSAPVQASLGETGLMNMHTDTLGDTTDVNLLVRVSAGGQRSLGVGVVTTWFMEATNFAGLIGRSAAIRTRAGDTSCFRE